MALIAGGVAFVIWHLHQRQQALYHSMALQGTAIQIESIRQMRRLYSAEVTTRAQAYGIAIGHDYETKDRTLPLPATLTMQLGEVLARERPGAHVRLFSDHPFPWRKKTGGARDMFEADALRELRRRPDLPFYRFEKFAGRESLRYAVADKLQASCVACHNSHPDSPKTDWKEGDVRGVLEFIRPLDNDGSAVASRRASLWWALGVTGGVLAAGLLGLGLTIRALRQEVAGHQHAKESLSQQAALATLGAEVGVALTKSDDLRTLLDQCAVALVRQLGGAFARIWTLNEGSQVLELQASAGLYTHLDGPHGRVPVGKFKIGLIAQERKAHLTNAVVGDPRVGDQAWAKREGMVAFAGYPLIVGDRVVGVMAMFARHPLSESTLQALASIADGIALGIVRKQAEESLREARSFALSTINALSAHVCVLEDTGKILATNATWQRFAEANSSATLTAVAGENYLEVCDAAAGSDAASERAFAAGIRAVMSHEREQFEMEYPCHAPSGQRWFVGRVTRFPGDGPVRVVVAHENITERKLAEMQLTEVHKQLVQISRQAGMAEVATSVLHNVGNVLNSVSVSAEVASGKVRQLRVGSLKSVAELLRQHAEDLPEFLTRDPQGRELPGYLLKLAERLAEPQQGILLELDALRKNIEHIKEIVAMQQTYARGGGVLEPVALAELIEDAVRINAAGFGRHEVQLTREISAVPPLVTDRHKLLQILVNLLNNAKYALDRAAGDKRLVVRVTADGAGAVRIEVIDNGVGIAAENLTRIFQHGFTTKKDGHGFGLHSGALTAKELGGRLTAHSDGVGRGAVFTLELPLQHDEARS